ncbi:MAG TPA: HAD family hydrolase [Thermoplasmata archaeon]|nr:HAD family hydrolase [Thermoplasmata archaeon]
MTLGTGDRTIEAIVFDLDDVLVPFHTVQAWQWAWRPQGPILGERHLLTAVRRSLHAWDRRRWEGVTGKAPPTDLEALRAHLAATLREIAGHAVAAEETEAVVRRMLRPAGEVERYPDVGPALERLAQAKVKVGVVTPLPLESARWLLHRVGIADDVLVGAGDPPGPCVPARDAFRAVAAKLGVPLARCALVGDLFWSDVRAAQRAGLTGILLDRRGAWPHVSTGRITTLGELEGAVVPGSGAGPSPPVGPSGAGTAGGRSSGTFL